jgi:hypothetical protein
MLLATKTLRDPLTGRALDPQYHVTCSTEVPLTCHFIPLIIATEMAALPKQDDSDAPVVVGRRSARLSMIVPVTIRGTDASGQVFKENTWTIGVNKHGAKLATFHQVGLGELIQIENPVLGRTAKARVKRVAEKRFSEDPYEIGIELLEAQNVWGVKFPPEDWQKGPSAVTTGRLPQKAGAPTPAEQPTSPARQPEPKAAESPRPAEAPAAQQAEPAEHPEQFNEFNLAVKALSRYAEQAEQTARASETTAETSERSDLPPRSGLLDVVRRLEEKVNRVSLVEQQVDSVMSRLEASRLELERLLSKVQEVQHHWRTEIERAPHDLEEAGWKALQPALEELNGKLRKEIESASSRVIEEGRQRVQEGASAAAEAFGKEASSRLASLTGEYISKTVPQLQAHESQATERARENIYGVIQKAAADFSEKLERLAGEMSPALEAEVEKSLEESAGQSMSRLIQTFQQMAGTAAGVEEGSFQRSMDKLRQQIQDEIATGRVKVRELYELEADAAGQKIAKHLESALGSLNSAAEDATTRLQATFQKIRVDFEGESEGLRKRMAELSGASLQGLQNYADTRLNGFRSELQETLSLFQENSAKEASARLQKVAEEQLDFSARQVQKQTAEALGGLRDKFEAAGKEFSESAKLQLESIARSTLVSLEQEAKASNEKFRDQLQRTVQETQERSTRDLEGRLEGAAEKQRAIILSEMEKEARASSERAVASLKNQSDRVTNESRDLMYRQVGMAEVVMKDWADQAKQRLDSYFEKSLEVFRKQIGEVSVAVWEGHLKKSEALAEGLHGRFQQAALLFRGVGSDVDLPKRLQIEPPAVPARVQTAVASELKVGGRKEDRTTNDATEAFRSKLAEILEGYQTRAKDSSERKS